MSREIQQLRSLEPTCACMSLKRVARNEEHLHDVAVLYITGEHSSDAIKMIRDLDGSGITLAILNFCQGAVAAKALVGQVGHVIYWPSKVPDQCACSFGVACIQHLHQDSIERAFAKARSAVALSQRAPLLLSKKKSQESHQESMSVILERRGSSSGSILHVGKPATVVPYTVDKVSNKFCQKLAVNSLETFTEIIDGLEDAKQGKVIHQNSTMLVN